MRINVNDPIDFTIEGVKSLVATGDENRNCQLRVTKDGYLFISYVTGNEGTDGIAFQFETSSAGSGYIGIGASEDESHINWIYNSIKENWPSNVPYCFTIDI